MVINFIDTFLQKLLLETVAQAHDHSPFWHEQLEATHEKAPLDAFLLLPVLSKTRAIAAGKNLYNQSLNHLQDRVYLSSGTTRTNNESLFIRRQACENEALHEFYKLEQKQHETTTAIKKTTVFECFNVFHGLPSEQPENVFRAPWMYQVNFPELAFTALEDALVYSQGSIDLVRGSVSALLTLALIAVDRGLNLAKYQTKIVSTNSYELTPRVKTILQQVYQPRVILNSYSLTEMPGSASKCPFCKAFHFGEPPIYIEYFSPYDAMLKLEPTAGAIARLVLTTLYPFVQRTPLLRFDTGDLVRIHSFCEEQSRWGFVPVGRAASSIFVPCDDGMQPIVLSGEFYSIVDSIPEIKRHPHPIEVLGILPGNRLGMPQSQLFWREQTLIIQLAVNEPAHHAAIQKQILDGLCATHPLFKKKLQDGLAIKFEFREILEPLTTANVNLQLGK